MKSRSLSQNKNPPWPVPGPGFNDIFAMASRGHATIEGDVGPLLEHLRYLKELAQLPRSILAQAR